MRHLSRDPLATARQARIQAICVMQRQLRMDEETLRALMADVTGKRSRKEMSLPELTAVRDRLVAKGATLTPPGGMGRTLAPGDQAKKLRALWLQGHTLGLIRDPAETAMASWASNSRSPNVTALLAAFGPADWTREIERLKKWLTREIRRGRLVCADGHRPIDLATTAGRMGMKLASDVLWGNPILCPACTAQDRECLLIWGGAIKTDSVSQTGSVSSER